MGRDLLHVSLVAAALFAGPSQTPAPPKPAAGDLGTVIAAIRNPTATPAQREALVGKIYAGTVAVDAVRLDPNDQSIATIMASPGGQPPTGDRALPKIGIRFAARADDEKIQQLRRGQSVRVRGTLKDISVSGSATWITLTDVVIEPM